MCSRTTPNISSLEVLNVATHAFIGCYGVIREVYVEKGKVGHAPVLTFTSTNIYRYDVILL